MLLCWELGLGGDLNDNGLNVDGEIVSLSTYLYIYISLCHKEHKALTFSFQPLRFAARVLTFTHDCHPPVFFSSSTILPHVVLGRPGLLFPSSLHSRAVTQCSSCLSSLYVQSNSIFYVWFDRSFCSLLCSPEFVGGRLSEATLFLKSSSYTCIGNRPASLLLFS